MKKFSTFLYMPDFKGFRKDNNLTQDDVAAYVGCKKAFICQIERGLRPMPEQMYSKLLNNNRGWNIAKLSSAELCSKEVTPTQSGITIPADVWQVIKDQAASLKIKDQQTAEVIAMLREQMHSVKNDVAMPFPAVVEDEE